MAFLPQNIFQCKIIAFSGTIAGEMFFLPVSKFCICLPLHVFAGVEMAKKPNETAKKPDETAKKSRSHNVKTETETAKKTGNGDILGNRRQLLLFRISIDNFA